jgi:hypothetical protein
MRKKISKRKLTQSEYASHRGLAQSTVAKMIRDGKINGAYEKKGRRYLIYPVKADTLLKSYDVSEAASSLPRHSIADANQSGSNFKPISFAEAARREKLAKAALLELQLKRECGELIDR